MILKRLYDATLYLPWAPRWWEMRLMAKVFGKAV